MTKLGRDENLPWVVEGPDLVGVERDSLPGLVPVIGRVGRHSGDPETKQESRHRRCRRRQIHRLLLPHLLLLSFSFSPFVDACGREEARQGRGAQLKRNAKKCFFFF